MTPEDVYGLMGIQPGERRRARREKYDTLPQTWLSGMMMLNPDGESLHIMGRRREASSKAQHIKQRNISFCGSKPITHNFRDSLLDVLPYYDSISMLAHRGSNAQGKLPPIDLCWDVLHQAFVRLDRHGYTTTLSLDEAIKAYQAAGYDVITSYREVAI